MIDETKIMQYADGTLPIEEHEEVKKAIEADPKLKELYNTFKETGDLLFKLGNEIKSQPLPKNLQDKADILKTWNKPIVKENNSLNMETSKEIYEESCKKIEDLNKSKIVAIGDSLDHDILGANNFNIDSVLISTGIHKDLFDNGPEIGLNEIKNSKKSNFNPTFICANFSI